MTTAFHYIAGLSLAVLLVSCGPSSTAPYAGYSVFEPTTGEYILRYVTPPWELTASMGTTATVEIPTPHVIEVDAEIPSKYRMDVTVAAGTAAAQIAADVAAAPAAMEVVSIPSRVFVTDSGDPGIEMLSARDGLNSRTFRRLAFDGASGTVIHIVVQSSAGLDTPEIDAMLRAFDVRTGTP